MQKKSKKLPSVVIEPGTAAFPFRHSAIWINLAFVFFSDFVFKIRLIRLGFLCKQKNSCIWTHNLQILSQESHNHRTKESTVSWRHRRAFSSLQSCLSINSINLIPNRKNKNVCVVMFYWFWDAFGICKYPSTTTWQVSSDRRVSDWNGRGPRFNPDYRLLFDWIYFWYLEFFQYT